MARAAGVPVIRVRAIRDPDLLPPGIRAKQLRNGADVCCGAGTAGAEFFGVAPVEGELVADKHGYSAGTARNRPA